MMHRCCWMFLSVVLSALQAIGGESIGIEVREEQAQSPTRRACVVYREQGSPQIAATVELSPSAIEVIGRVGALPYHSRWSPVTSDRGRGVSVLLEYGTASFQGEIFAGEPDDATLARLAEFRRLAEGTAGWEIVRRYGAAFQESRISGLPALFASLAGFAAGGAVVPLAPVDRLWDCVEQACWQAGACWNPSRGCELCPGTGADQTFTVNVRFIFGFFDCLLEFVKEWFPDSN